MTHGDIVDRMLPLLQETLDQHEPAAALTATTESPLIGRAALLTSLALVAFISDVETMLAEVYCFEVTLVSEHAFSRSKSPFRSVDSLADYILELASSHHAA